MFPRLLSRALFVSVYLPAFVIRRVLDTSPFSKRAHRADSAWDF